MNTELYSFIETLITLQGVNTHKKLTAKDKKVILGYILLDHEEPINFLVETDCHKRFMHHFVNYLTKNKAGQFISILDIYAELEDSALFYHQDRIINAFEEAKEKWEKGNA